MVYKSSSNKYKQRLFNVYAATVNGYSFLALHRKIRLSVSSSKCLHLLFMTQLLYVWLQQRPDRQKGKRMDTKQIKDSELKYPNLAHCSAEIKSVDFKIRKPPCQPSINQKKTPGPAYSKAILFTTRKITSSVVIFCSTGASCLSTGRAIWATLNIVNIFSVKGDIGWECVSTGEARGWSNPRVRRGNFRQPRAGRAVQ